MADTPLNQPNSGTLQPGTIQARDLAVPREVTNGPIEADATAIAQKSYSVFFPVFAVFVVLAVSYAFYLGGDFNERAQIRRAQAELAPVVPQAQRVLKIADDLSKDLVALAGANNAEAAKIVADFNIKTNRAPAAATAPAPAAAQ